MQYLYNFTASLHGVPESELGGITIKIAIFHMGFFYSGGGERTVIQEALELEKRGHQVEVYAPIIRSERCFPKLIQKIRVKGYLPVVPVSIPMREALSMVASSVLSPALAGRFRQYDAFICHGQPSIWIGYVITSILRKPYICYLHQPNRFLYPRAIDIQVGWSVNPSLRVLYLLIGKLGRRFTQLLDRLSVTKADAVLTNSKWIAQWVKRVYGVQPEVCYPGVDSSFLETVREVDFSIESKKPFILSTGRHYPQKRIDWLIQMMPKIIQACPSASLIITGRFTNYTSRLLELCKDLRIEKKVIFTEEVSEQRLKQLYTGANVCVYPAPEEDFGLGPIEAGACRTPSVVWDHAGPTETVIEGTTGYRAKPYDLDDYANKVLRILMDNCLRNRLGLNAFSYVKRYFTWKDHVNKLEFFINNL